MLARRQLFVEKLLVDKFALPDAYRFAYGHFGMADREANDRASKLIKVPEISAAIERGKALAIIRSEATGEMIVDQFYQLATADARELINVYVGSCRFCWGVNFSRQWTLNEYRDALKEAELSSRLAKSVDPTATVTMPDIAGGIGFNPTIEPNPSCPECFGNGANYVKATDTRDLSPQGALLYAGAKQKADGSFEIMMQDRLKAGELFGRARGVFIDRVRHEGSISLHAAVTKAIDPHEASQAYQELVKGPVPQLALPPPDRPDDA